MQNLKIEIEDGIYYVLYEGVTVGQIEQCFESNTFLVFPNGGHRSAAFFSFEEAIIELLFHEYWKKYNVIYQC